MSAGGSVVFPPFFTPREFPSPNAKPMHFRSDVGIYSPGGVRFVRNTHAENADHMIACGQAKRISSGRIELVATVDHARKTAMIRQMYAEQTPELVDKPKRRRFHDVTKPSRDLIRPRHLYRSDHGQTAGFRTLIVRASYA